MNWLRQLFGTKRDTNTILATVDKQHIERAFLRRAKELESLRKHDSGEKIIDAPELVTLARRKK